MLPQKNPRPPSWYFKSWGMIFLLLLFGPLAFPFLWMSKTFSKRWKVILTVVFTLLTIWATVASIDIIRNMLEQFRSAGLLS